MLKVAIVTLGWREYTMKYFEDFMASVRVQDYEGKTKVFVVDNETTPETVIHIQKHAPEANLILNQKNDGFAKGMNDGIREAMREQFDYIAVVNIHSQIESNYISELVKAMEADEKIGVAQGLILLPDKKTILSQGNASHFLGFGYSVGYKEEFHVSRFTFHDKDIFYPSGSSMMFRRGVLEKVGLMDEQYWMYNEDQEIGWRLRLAGFKCVLAPKAVMTTDYQHERSMTKVFWMDRNRILSMLLCYQWLTLLLILPAFLIMELGQIIFAWQNKWLKEKLRVYLYFLLPNHWAYIWKARQRNQTLRQTSDKEICQLIVGEIKHQEFTDWKLKIANLIFGTYWQAVKKLII